MSVNDKTSLPIGFMDSGLGGLSVLREAVRLMPSEDFIYYGDSANAPYGTKHAAEILRLTEAAVDELMRRGIKGLTIACNTATAAAVKTLRQKYRDMPVIGIEPAVKPAVEHYSGGRILVMATPMTIAQEKFHTLLAKYTDLAEIIPVPCGGLMEFVEHGVPDDEVLRAYFDEHLAPFINDRTETIVLGCTHYPFLKRQIRAYIGSDIRLIDGSAGTAAELRRQLAERGLLRTEERTGHVTILNSSPDAKMIRRSERLLNMPLE